MFFDTDRTIGYLFFERISLAHSLWTSDGLNYIDVGTTERVVLKLREELYVPGGSLPACVIQMQARQPSSHSALKYSRSNYTTTSFSDAHISAVLPDACFKPHAQDDRRVA